MMETDSETMRLMQEHRKCLARLVAAMEARIAAKPSHRWVCICAVQSNPELPDGRIHDLRNKQTQ